uniref:Uncharacterized protein n=1 Tax=Oryza sativa subsp. japonica TaxID=39947 RepID=Q7XHS3_ORYSJ|nr:hypothetical protein [Oryza sativa Japonica Group]
MKLPGDRLERRGNRRRERGAASLRCSTAVGSALAAPKKLLNGRVSIEEPRAGDVGEECDMFDPLYVGFRCSENGRPDDPYTKWRWRSLRCFH